MGMPETRWTLVDAAGAGDDAAFAELVAKYRAPVLAYLRRRGLDAHQAEDLAQEVFLQLFRGVLPKADPERGRFRTLLLTVSRNVAAKHFEKARALKRGGGQPVEALGERELAAPEAEEAFELAWARRLLELALERLEREHPDCYASVRGFLLEGRSQADLAEHLGRSPVAVKNLVYRGKRRLIAFVREELRAYARDSAELADEVRLLERFLPPG